MTRYAGIVGYAAPGELEDGIWEDGLLVERTYYGDVVRNSRRIQNGSSVLPELTISNSISIVADAYAMEHFYHMKYIYWQGVPWTITNVDVQRPRLILELGGVYHGPTIATPEASGGDSGE